MSLYQKASLVQIPSGYKAADAKLYSVVPNSGDGDFTVSSDADATRVNKDGLIETTVANQARLNYDPTNPQDPHLLLEPSRTNSLPESENFSTNWIKLDTTLSSGISSPDGGTNAYSLIEGTGTGGKIIYDTISVSAGSVTYSLFMKKGDKRYTGLLLSGVVTTSMFNVDLENGTGTTATGSFDSTNIEEYPNGWYRISVTTTATAGNLNCNVYLMNGASYNDRNYAGNGTDKTYIFGAQLEAGSYATSYIPTSGSAVTRTVDNAINLLNNATPTSYPFTVFVEMSIQTGKKGFGFSFLNRFANYLYYSVGYCEVSANNKFRFTNRGDGNIYAVETTAQYFTGKHKIAVKFVSETNFKAFINGVEVVNLTHTASPFQTNNTSFLLGQLRTVTDTGDRNPIHQFMVFKEALTDAELITLTT
jgi:hypothetical protein